MTILNVFIYSWRFSVNLVMTEWNKICKQNSVAMELAPTLCFTLFLENNPLQHLIKKKKRALKNWPILISFLPHSIKSNMQSRNVGRNSVCPACLPSICLEPASQTVIHTPPHEWQLCYVKPGRLDNIHDTIFWNRHPLKIHTLHKVNNIWAFLTMPLSKSTDDEFEWNILKTLFCHEPKGINEYIKLSITMFYNKQWETKKSR